MQNLEDFEPPAASPSDDPAGPQGAPQKPKSAMDDLSNMLGSLEQDMEHIHGVSTVAKGMCAACKKPILAKVLDALGRQWHPEHFVCAGCEMDLSNATYYENNGRPYCEKDYHELFAPRCAYCNGPILEVSSLSLSLSLCSLSLLSLLSLSLSLSLPSLSLSALSLLSLLPLCILPLPLPLPLSLSPFLHFKGHSIKSKLLAVHEQIYGMKWEF